MSSNIEGRILLAIQAFRLNRIQSLRAASKAYDVPFSSLQKRYSGVQSRQETRPVSCKLTQNEEDVLLQRILDLDAQGFPPRLDIVRDIANIILSSRTKQPPLIVGKNWVNNFIKRQPSLQTKYNRKYDYQRAMCEDREQIEGWFRLVRNTIAKYGIL